MKKRLIAAIILALFALSAWGWFVVFAQVPQPQPVVIDKDSATLPNGDKVEIGNHDTKDFEPCIKLNRWGDEAYLKIWLPTAEKQDASKLTDVITWQGTDIDCKFYELEPSSDYEYGGYEFEIVFKSKPPSNIITLNMETQGLEFYYQPVLTAQEIADGNYRPENIVGSYAVYHDSRQNNEYKTGKAFHVPRPRLIDDIGTEVWGDLHIDVEAGTYTVTIPQSFLDKAIYPIYHVAGATFGYTSVGASTLFRTNDMICYKDTISENGTIDSISAYLRKDSGSPNYKGSVYLDADDSLIDCGDIQAIPSSPAWVVSNGNDESLTDSTTYQICYWGGTTGHYIYLDSGGSSDNNYRSMSVDPNGNPCPDPFNPVGQTSSRYSIYCTYTPAAEYTSLDSTGYPIMLQ